MINNLFGNVNFDRPIFLVGSAKSGTTILGLLFRIHPDVGPKTTSVKNIDNAQKFIDSILIDNKFNMVANELEEKNLWDNYFPIPEGVVLRQGKELRLFNNPLSKRQTRNLKKDLGKSFKEKRFFSKQPFNTFRIHVLREIFPDAKILAVHRDGRNVISSWGRKENRWKRFGGYEAAIKLMASKWEESIDHIENHKDELNIKTVKYEDLVGDTNNFLKDLFSYCDLSYHPDIYKNLKLRENRILWQQRIPEEYHQLVNEVTKVKRIQLGYI